MDTFCGNCGISLRGPAAPAPEPDAAGLVSKATLVSQPDASPVQPRREVKATVWQVPPVPEKPVASELAGALPDSPAREAQAPSDSDAAVPELPANDVLARIVHPVNSVGLALPVGKPEVTLGRDDPVRGIYPDLDLTDYGGPVGGVSRLHARISIVSSESAGGFKFYIEDLDSVNGTFVNEVKVAPGTRRQLADSDELRLGRVKVIFQIAGREAKP
jgi:hypothetical protein